MRPDDDNNYNTVRLTTNQMIVLSFTGGARFAIQVGKAEWCIPTYSTNKQLALGLINNAIILPISVSQIPAIPKFVMSSRCNLTQKCRLSSQDRNLCHPRWNEITSSVSRVRKNIPLLYQLWCKQELHLTDPSERFCKIVVMSLYLLLHLF